MTLLEVNSLQAGYGKSQVLFDVSLRLGAGEIISLLGRNGMGKTTTIKTVMGLLPLRGGSIHINGVDTNKWPSYKIANTGLGLVPEGRQIFPNLTARENLIATAANRANSDSHWSLSRVLELFPKLTPRLGSMGNLLSGGEQQMLAIGRALMTNPRALLLDDATEGLAPQVRTEIWRCLAQLKSEGLAILVVDKNVKDLLPLVDRHYIIEKGRTVWQGSSADWINQPELHNRYLGV